jgi:hypothetical protein
MRGTDPCPYPDRPLTLQFQIQIVPAVKKTGRLVRGFQIPDHWHLKKKWGRGFKAPGFQRFRGVLQFFGGG